MSQNQGKKKQKTRSERQETFKLKSRLRRQQLQQAVQTEPYLVAQLCTMMFVGLKLHGSIDWSWWYIFTPLYISYFIELYKIQKEQKLVDKMTKEELERRAQEIIDQAK